MNLEKFDINLLIKSNECLNCCYKLGQHNIQEIKNLYLNIMLIFVNL